MKNIIGELFKQKQTTCPVHIIDTDVKSYPAMPLTECDSILNIYMKEQDLLREQLPNKHDINCRINKCNYEMVNDAHSNKFIINNGLLKLILSTVSNRSYLLIRQFLENIGYYNNTNPEIEQYIAALVDDKYNRIDHNIYHVLNSLLDDVRLNIQIPQTDWNMFVLSITNIFEMNMYNKFSKLINVLLLYMDIPKDIAPLGVITAMTNIANSVILTSHDTNLAVFADTLNGILNAMATINSNPYYQEKLPHRYDMFDGFDDDEDY